MKIPLTALALASLAVAAYADDTSSNSGSPVPNGHGGYNISQPVAPRDSLAFFGGGGFATKVIQESHHEKPKFIIVPVTQNDGHSNHVVYKKIHFATAEEAEAAKAKQ